MMVGFVWYRRWLLLWERFKLYFGGFFAALHRVWMQQGRRDKVLIALLVLVIAGALGVLGYAVAQPKATERFTEFYLLSQEGGDYPGELVVGEEGRVTLGIVNREQEPVAYRVVITLDGEKLGERGPVTLDHEEEWEREMSFTPTRTGRNQKVEFHLYKGRNVEVYRALHLWIDIKEKGT